MGWKCQSSRRLTVVRPAAILKAKGQRVALTAAESYLVAVFDLAGF
jgi:hypothetical protein